MTAEGLVRGWPATLTEPDLLDAPVVLQPARVSDARIRRAARAANDSWLRPWNPTRPDPRPRRSPAELLAAMTRWSPVPPYLSAVRGRREARLGTAFSWVIRYGGQFAGEVTIWHVQWGPARSAEVGYWIDERLAGRGIMPTALALCADHCFAKMGLHRLEAGIQPKNTASRRVVEKLGFRDEGTRIRLVHVDGSWQDHICYAITAEETPDGLLARWRSSLAASRTALADVLRTPGNGCSSVDVSLVSAGADTNATSTGARREAGLMRNKRDITGRLQTGSCQRPHGAAGSTESGFPLGGANVADALAGHAQKPHRSYPDANRP